MSTFRFTNNITLFLRKLTFVSLASIWLYIVKDFLLRAMNVIFSISIFSLLYHFKSTYLRFYWRYLNHFCFVRNLISSSWKMRHEPHFGRAPHCFLPEMNNLIDCLMTVATLITDVQWILMITMFHVSCARVRAHTCVRWAHTKKLGAGHRTKW